MAVDLTEGNTEREKPDFTALDQEWWDTWWASDYSWSGLAEKLVGMVGDRLPDVAHEKRTLQEYWRRDPASGVVRSDEEMLALGELMLDPEGELWHIVHMPIDWHPSRPQKASPTFRSTRLELFFRNLEEAAISENNHPSLTWKADLTHANWKRIAEIVSARLNESAETRFGYGGNYSKGLPLEGPDNRAQLSGAVLKTLPPRADDTASAVHIEATQVRFLEHVSCENWVFGPHTTFTRAWFEGCAEFRKATFSGLRVFFDGTSFAGLSGNLGDADFDWARFEASCIFTNARFRGCSTFENAKFVRGSAFDQVRFGPNTRFSRAEFSREANFGDAIFGRSQFKETKFLDIAQFSGAQFKGESDFVGSYFLGIAHMRGSEMFGDPYAYYSDFHSAYFARSVFCSIVRFSGSNWLGDADFSRVVFEKDAEFLSVRFLGEADFSDGFFAGNANFSGAAEFNNRAVFRNARFEGFAYFAYARFRDVVVCFEDVVFSRDVILDNVHAEECWGGIDFRGARFFARLFMRGARVRGGVEVSREPASTSTTMGFFLARARSFFGTPIELREVNRNRYPRQTPAEAAANTFFRTAMRELTKYIMRGLFGSRKQ